MVAPLTPKPTHKAEALTRVSPTIASSREEDAALRKWPLSRYRCASCILETKTKVGNTGAKAPDPRTNPNIDEAPTDPNHTRIHHTNAIGRARDPEAMTAPPTPKPTLKAEALARVTSTIASSREEVAALRKWPLSRYRYASCILETKTKVGSTTVTIVVYYESIKRELKRRLIYEYPYDERLKTKTECEG